MSDLLAYDFLRHAVLAGLLASLLCGVVGTFVVVRRLVFLGGGVAHAAFGGLGLCHYLGLPPLAGAAAVAMAAAMALGSSGRAAAPGPRRSHDAGIGILWALGMAVGVIFLHLTPGYGADLMTYLFGNILTVTRTHLLWTLAFVALVLAFLALFYKEFVAVCFDEEFAAVQGVPTRGVTTLLLVLTALAVVLLIRLVGILLVMALLTVPPVVSLRLVRGFAAAMALSALLGAAMTLGGLALSYAWELPSGPTIVLLGAAMLGAVTLGQRLGRARLVQR